MPPDPTTPQTHTTPDTQQNMDVLPVDTTPLAPESAQNGFTSESGNMAIPVETLENEEIPKAPETLENPVSVSIPTSEAVAETPADTEPVADKPTAQMGRNEPLTEATPPSVSRNPIRELLAKAQNAIQFRKRKKLNKVMDLFLKNSKITNDEVEKLLHVSDATATRYLEILQKENKIKKNGKTGKWVSYSKI